MQTDALTQNRMDLKTAVMLMDNNLHDDDVEGMTFLCQGLVPGSRLKRIDMAHTLVNVLESSCLVSDTDFFLLAELLQYIRRVDVLESIGYDEKEVIFLRRRHESKVKPFNVLLYRIAEELSVEDVKKASFMYGKVPRVYKITSGMDLFSLMAQHQTISSKDVNLLLNIFCSIDRQDIVEIIQKYCDTAGESVIYDTEQSYSASSPLRNVSNKNSSPPLLPQPAQGVGRGFGCGRGHDQCLGPSIDEHEKWDTSSSGSRLTPASQHTSMANHPPSFTYATPSAPPESLPQPFHVQPANDALCVNNISEPAFGIPEAEGSESDERRIPGQVLDFLAKKIPAHCWPSFTNHLGLHLDTESWDISQRNFSEDTMLLRRWLALPGTLAMDNLKVRTLLVQAAYYSGATLMAQEIAPMLNVEINNILHDSLSSQATIYDSNEVASTGEAAYISMEMENIQDGYCVIINNRNFYAETPQVKRMPDREGTDVDKVRLEHTFKNLDFIVKSHDNCTDTDMIQILNQFANRDNHSFDCFVCCILTHGTQGALYGCNSRTVPIRDLTHPFRPQQCPDLAGKPKLFFLQACQGNMKQEAVQGHPDVQKDTPIETDGPTELIPNESDFLLGYATVPGFVSYRSKKFGSWYITTLTQLLNKHAFHLDILDILTLVNYEVSRENAVTDEGHYKQTPAPMYSLRKKLIFGHP